MRNFALVLETEEVGMLDCDGLFELLRPYKSIMVGPEPGLADRRY